MARRDFLEGFSLAGVGALSLNLSKPSPFNPVAGDGTQTDEATNE